MSTNPDRNLQLQNEAVKSHQSAVSIRREAIELDLTGDPGPALPSTSNIEGSAKNKILKDFIHQIAVFWSRQISIVVSRDDCRDHFGEKLSE